MVCFFPSNLRKKGSEKRVGFPAAPELAASCLRLRSSATPQRSRSRPPAPPRASFVLTPGYSLSAVYPAPPLRRLTPPHPRASPAPATHPWLPPPPPPHNAQAAAAAATSWRSPSPRYAFHLPPSLASRYYSSECSRRRLPELVLATQRGYRFENPVDGYQMSIVQISDTENWSLKAGPIVRERLAETEFNIDRKSVV